MAESPDASLVVNKKEHLGWTEMAVTRSLEQLAHTFELSFTERWSDEEEGIPIRAGDACTLRLGSKQITAGYVDGDGIDYDANDKSMHVTGRSGTGDLVDCSAIFGGGQWKKKYIDSIARDLCQPFGITVKVDGGVDLGDAFGLFAVHSGETVFETLERGCRLRGLIMTTSSVGDLVFTAIGNKSTRTVIEYGVNVLRGSRSGSTKDRFRTYIIKGQAPGNDDTNGKAASQPKATETDTVVSRYRPLIIQAEAGGSSGQLKRRAAWERNTRAGRSVQLHYTLNGWTDDDNQPWEPNTLVHVTDPKLEVDSELLIVSVRQSKSNVEGAITELDLVDPLAMTVQPLTVQPKKRKANAPEEYLRGNK